MIRTTALAVTLFLVGCGEPPPKVPAPAPTAPPPPAAPAPSTGDACNELLLGVQALKSVEGRTHQPSASIYVRAARQGVSAFAEFRARLKNAAALDPSMANDVQTVDQMMAERTKTLEDNLAALETSSKELRELVFALEVAAKPFFGCTGGRKNPDCGASTIVVTSIPTIWTTTFLTRDRADIARVQFKSADLSAKRDALLKRFDAIFPIVAEQEKREAIAPKEGGDLAKALVPLYETKCKLDGTDAADMAVPKTDWVVADKPDLRKLVLVVQVVPEGRIRARLGEWAASSIGAKRDAFDGAALGGFGSGFYVVPRGADGKSGDPLIVTNRHVVDFGDRATLIAPDGTQTAAEILYTDPKADLAVLKPVKSTVTAGLGLEPTVPKDQEVVIATGYPGLGATPSYQTTRGYVSNQHFIDSFDNGVYIQHTAPLDKGSSGGPLTTEAGNVLGVNTLKIHDRENVAMSVPAAAVARAVRQATSKPSADDLREDARAACLDVIAEVSATKPNINTLFQRISLAMVSESGSAAFNSEVKWDKDLGDLLYDEPVDALRYAIIDRLESDAVLSFLSPFETCASPNADDFEHIETMDRIRYQIHAGAETKDLVLRREHGRYQLLRFELRPPEPEAPAKKPAKKPKPKKAQAAQK